MMRARTFSILHSALAGTATLAIAAASVAALPALAQSSPGGFSLPSPTPTPSSAPQGPADERAGVPIGPRVIRQPTPTPTPQATIAPAPTPTPTPTSGPTPASTATQGRSTPTPSPTRTTRPTTGNSAPSAQGTTASRPSAPTPTETRAADARDTGARGTEIPLSPDVGPGFDSLGDTDEELAPVGPDDWYDVDGADEPGRDYSAEESSNAIAAWDTTQNRMIAGVVLILLLIGAVAATIWRRRRREHAVQSTPNTILASGVRKSMANQMPSILQDTPGWAKGAATKDATTAKPKPAAKPEPKPEPAPRPAPAPKVEVKPSIRPDTVPVAPVDPQPAHEAKVAPEPEPEVAASPAIPAAGAASSEAIASRAPARIDLDLEIVSATRSFMMFTVEFRVEVANRSDHAVRDLAIAARLSSAQGGKGSAAPVAGGQPIATIDRIGPQQSRRVGGTLQMPLSEVTPIRQGSKPLLIPLLHLTLEGAGQATMNRSFVLGTPSATGSGRVHPLPLDGPPGGLPQLRAQAIKQPEPGDAQSTETA